MELGKFAFLLNLERGPIPEPPVIDEVFLESFLRVGVWIRVLAASQHHNTLLDAKSSSLERYAAIIAIYQLAGMVYEDAVVALIAWTVKTKYPDLSLADILNRTNLARNANATTDNLYHNHVANQFHSKATNSVRVNPQLFLRSLASLSEKALLECFGIPWKTFPSVKLVPKEARNEWESLPGRAGDLVGLLADEKKDLVTKSYNKLKHGPQLIIANSKDAMTARGHDESKVEKVPNRELVRLLFSGGGTQEYEGEQESGKRVAPFLIDYTDNASRLFYEFVVLIPFLLKPVGRWVFRCMFRRDPPLTEDEAVIKLRDSAVKRLYLNSRPPERDPPVSRGS